LNSVCQLLIHCAGGKAKPLKAPKKEKKELDEEDIAFREKQKAGTWSLQCRPQNYITARAIAWSFR